MGPGQRTNIRIRKRVGSRRSLHSTVGGGGGGGDWLATFSGDGDGDGDGCKLTTGGGGGSGVWLVLEGVAPSSGLGSAGLCTVRASTWGQRSTQVDLFDQLDHLRCLDTFVCTP